MAIINGTIGPNILIGTGLADVISGLAGNDVLIGLGGNDNLFGGAGRDVLFGGRGNDLLNGGLGADVMLGGLGDDTYVVNTAADFVFEDSDEGVDTVRSSISYTLGDNLNNLTLTGVLNRNGVGNDLGNEINGNAGNNILFGLGGGDTINGGAGRDVIVGGIGNDVLNGGLGNDSISGGPGNDAINGGRGQDFLTGGAGNNSFVFDAPLGLANRDVVLDFEVANDTFLIDNSVFVGLAAGPLAAAAFRIGAVAADATDRIIYNSGTGNLFFDVDGVGGAGQQLFANAGPGLALTASDFVVI